MVPTVLFPPATPSTDHVTDVLVVPVTNAVNCWVPRGASMALVGITVSRMTLTAALALLLGSAALVAVTVCLSGLEGAVYNPLLLTVPTVLLPPFTPSTDHVMALLVSPTTVAVNC